jgi:hypothetical protein
MSADTAGRAALDDPLMIRLRETLDQVDAIEAAGSTISPPWERIQQGMSRARRRRHRVRAARVGAGLLALTTVGAATLTGVLPYPSFAPTVAIPGYGGRSALDDGRVRGSLGSDVTWLRALREHVAAGATWQEAGGETWSPPPAGDISVLYAGDLGEYRVALVEGNWHWGPIAARQQAWLFGPAGAPAGRLEQEGTDEVRDVVTNVHHPEYGLSGPSTAHSTSVIVLSARAVRVQVEGPPAIDAQAKVTAQVRTLSGSKEGLYQTTVTQPGRYKVIVDGRSDGSFDATESGLDGDRLVSAQKPVRGGTQTIGVRMLAGVAQPLWEATLQPVQSQGFRLLAAEPGYRDTGGNPVRALVGRITLPSGARVLGMGQSTSGAEEPEEGPDARLDAAVLLPAGRDADLSVAWRIPADPGAASTHPGGTRGWTAAMGPAGTKLVEWVHRDGTVVSVEAEDTLATTDRDDVELVHFLDSTGHRVGAAQVLDPLATMHEHDPRSLDPWVLPEIQAKLVKTEW